MKVEIRFFDSEGNQVGYGESPYPPGAAYVQIGYGLPASETIPPRDLLTDRLTEHEIRPGRGEPLFGADAREVSPAEPRPLYPLISRCQCGRQVTQEEDDASWLHCD